MRHGSSLISRHDKSIKLVLDKDVMENFQRPSTLEIHIEELIETRDPVPQLRELRRLEGRNWFLLTSFHDCGRLLPRVKAEVLPSENAEIVKVRDHIVHGD